MLENDVDLRYTSPMKKSVLLVGAAALAFVLAACGGGSDGGSTDGGDTPGPAPDAGVQIVSTGSWNNIGLGSGSWGWGVVLENPGSEAIRVNMTVDALNAAGDVVDSYPQMWVTVQAGATGVMAGGFLGVPEGEQVVGIDISSITTSASWFGSSTLTVSGVTQDDKAVSGTVTNGSDAALPQAWVHAVHVDGGTVVGGGSTFIEVPASGNAPFTLNLTGAQTGELVVSADPPYEG